MKRSITSKIVALAASLHKNRINRSIRKATVNTVQTTNGNLELLAEKYELSCLIINTVQLNMLRIGSKAIKFELYVDKHSPVYLFGDEHRVRQILNNILSNAFKYTVEGTVKMTVTVEESGRSEDDVILSIIISDTGQGMTKEQVDKLFDEYSQKAPRSGMSITNNLVRMMNGDIFVKSKPGKGSTFTVRLPQYKIGADEIGARVAKNLQHFRPSNKTQTKGWTPARRIAGLSTNKGLQRYNNEKEYLSVLRTYSNDIRSLLKKMEFVDDNKLEEYKIIVHGIKGASFDIFAGQVGDAAKGLEIAADIGDLEYIGKHNRLFIKATGSFLDKLDDMLSTIDTKMYKPEKENLDSELISRLLIACNNFDIDDAEAIMAEIDYYKYTSDDGLADWLREKIEMTDLLEIECKLVKMGVQS